MVVFELEQCGESKPHVVMIATQYDNSLVSAPSPRMPNNPSDLRSHYVVSIELGIHAQFKECRTIETQSVLDPQTTHGSTYLTGLGAKLLPCQFQMGVQLLLLFGPAWCSQNTLLLKGSRRHAVNMT